jgi:hypothetical protein
MAFATEPRLAWPGLAWESIAAALDSLGVGLLEDGSPGQDGADRVDESSVRVGDDELGT